MYVYDSHPDNKKTNNLYEDKKIDSNKNSCNSYKYNSVYNNNKEKTYHQANLNHNYSFNNYQRINHNLVYNRQLNNKTPHRHHHHHLVYFHHHCHTPLSHSHSTSRSFSCSCSPSPIKNISQPIMNTSYKNKFNNLYKASNQRMYNNNYNNQNYNNKCSKSKIFKFDNITKANEYINNIYNKQIKEHEIEKNNSILFSNSFINTDNEASFSNAKDFDEYMTKVVLNKYNKMKRFNESNYSHNQIEDDLNYNRNNNNSNYNNESFINEYNLIKKNLEEKYKLYNLISNYDDINVKNENTDINKYNSNINKIANNENYNENTKDKTNENIKEDLIIDKSYENEQNKVSKQEKNIKINKDKTQKVALDNDKKNKNKKHNYRHDKHVYNSDSNNNENDKLNSSELIETGFSPEIKRNENFSIIKENSNKIDNIIQKTFNERIGPDSNINNIKSSYDNKNAIHKDDSHNDKNNENDNNNIQIKSKENINEHNLFDYITKENEELKKLNNLYKQILDILFYFLNNISQKNQKKIEESNNEITPSKLFDLSKDLNDLEEFSKKLINLEFLVNNNKDNNNNLENDNENEKDNLKINNNISKNINNKDKINSLILKITKENSIQLPKLSKLAQLNNLIEGMNEKIFSFKDEEHIENFLNDNNKYDKNFINKSNNSKIGNNNKNILNIDNDKKQIDKQIIDTVNNGSDRCFACLLGCNISKRGYSPMRYNPYTKNELRIDDSGYLLDRYNELKVSFDNDNIGKFNTEKNKYHKIPKNNKNAKYNSLNNSRDNSKLIQKKIWK